VQIMSVGSLFLWNAFAVRIGYFLVLAFATLLVSLRSIALSVC